jgi:hypothetical protein
VNISTQGRVQAGVAFATDKQGVEHLVAVAKATYRVWPDGTCTPAEVEAPLVLEDQFYGEPGLSSIRYETDFGQRKAKTDVILVGHACAARGVAADIVDVALQVGQLRKVVRVFGDRIWKSSLGVYSPSKPAPFLKMPLRYERAFGGADRSHSDQKRHAFEERNLVGAGFHKRNHDGIAGTPLPNIENPQQLVSSPFDRPAPAGFGFVSRNWMPRRRYAGTYDEKWLEEEFPFLPQDFDERYFQGAPEDQWCGPLRGGEQVRVAGVTPAGLWGFTVPAPRIEVKIVSQRGEEDLRPILDTLILEPDEERVMLVWRTCTPLRVKASRLEEVSVGILSRGRQRAAETGKEYVDWSRTEE